LGLLPAAARFEGHGETLRRSRRHLSLNLWRAGWQCGDHRDLRALYGTRNRWL